jgi:peptidoglycan/xylan/chitin deacetylase (PgdA/CDA1 family)
LSDRQFTNTEFSKAFASLDERKGSIMSRNFKSFRAFSTAKSSQRLRDSATFALAYFSKLSLQQERAILMYHSIASNDDFFTVDPRKFDLQIDYLRENYTIVSLEEMAACIRNATKLPRKAAAITFDDGYEDCYLNAYPYLRDYDLPATVFVSTGYVGKEWPFTRSRSRNRLKMLTWKEIEEMSKNNIEIGAHTVTHLDLREADLETARNEVAESKRQIEEHIKKTVTQFSFPFGRCSSKTVDLVKSLGFKTIVGDLKNAETPKSPKGNVLKRVQVDSSVSQVLFKALLTKATYWLGQLEH